MVKIYCHQGHKYRTTTVLLGIRILVTQAYVNWVGLMLHFCHLEVSVTGLPSLSSVTLSEPAEDRAFSQLPAAFLVS